MNSIPVARAIDGRLVIRGLSCISAWGEDSADMVRALAGESSPHVPLDVRGGAPVAPLSEELNRRVQELSRNERFKRLDRVTLLALVAARSTLSTRSQLFTRSQEYTPISCVCIGSSRGATATLESTIEQLLDAQPRGSGAVPTHTSPSTTAGTISSWVAQEVLAHSSSPEQAPSLVSLDTSMTCTSAFHALLCGVAFVRSGLADAVLFGGSESCLTPYTISQLQALRIYSAGDNSSWPGKPLAASAEMDLLNTVTLGEGAGTAVLERWDGTQQVGDIELLGLGWQLERIPSATGVSLDGQGFEAAMQMATAQLSESEPVDAVIAHAPGSVRGDEAELLAIERVFGPGFPVFSTKHVTGHTYGASGMVSLQLARWLLEGNKWPGFPYAVRVAAAAPNRAIRRILINTAGFGGNTISVVVGLPSSKETSLG